MPDELLALPILAGDFWLAFFLVQIPFVTLVHFATKRSSAGSPLRRDIVGGVAFLFFLLWFVRVEPAHQLFSVNPHLSTAGIVDVSLIIAASLLLYLWGTRCKPANLPLVLAGLLAGCVLLESLARFQEPGRDRNEATRQLSQYLGPVAAKGTLPPRRVLMIGIDGMDWRVVSDLLRSGKLPAIAGLMDHGRYYQLDNLHMRLSPEIWTSAYTGVRGGRNGVDSFLHWQFAGIKKPLVQLPKFGVHSVLYLERVLWDLRFLQLWTGRPVSNIDFTVPPLWTILSSSGRHVAVIDPLPTDSVPEQVSGVFVLANGMSVRTFSQHRRDETPLHAPARRSPAVALVEWERARVSVISNILRRDRYDAVIYYTHFLDGIQHMEWSSMNGSASIDNGYMEADRTIRSLIDSFGQPATVVLLSDHGWEFNEYEHFMSPMGMLAVSPARNPGYGGTASVLSVAPTVLSIAGVAPSTSMQATALPVGQQVYSAADDSRLVARKYYSTTSTDHELMKRLRALGYIGH